MSDIIAKLFISKKRPADDTLSTSIDSVVVDKDARELTLSLIHI